MSPHSENGVTPAAFSVAASANSPCQVVGVPLMPATANSAGLYQMVFLLAALNQTPYSLPL